MKFLILLLFAACAAAQYYPGFYGHPEAYAPYHGYQFHSQDELRQYSFGHAGGPNSRHESRRYDGVVTGGYNYIDAYGQHRFVEYVSDPVHGFRIIGANNLPVAPGEVPLQAGPAQVGDSVEVQAAKEKFFRIYNEAAAAAEAAPDTKK